MNRPPSTALGPLHVPPTCGAPPSAAKSEVDGLLMHKVSASSVPAFGGATSVTVTVLLAFTHGAGTTMVYVYTPGVIVAGSYCPPTTALGPLHAPPRSGVPPSSAKRSMAASVLHSVMVPGVPASGASTTVTVMLASSAGQGALPATV